MVESEGTHGPVNEEVIASLFEKHHGPKAYSMREGSLPDWYTNGFQYFYLIYEGKILTVIGFSNWGNYNVLGGALTYRPWKKKSNYFGNPIDKVIMARQPYLGNRPSIAGFSNHPGWQERMIEAGWKMNPMDNMGIDEDMVDNFRERYGSHPEKTWGILTGKYDVEKMIKAYADFDSNWWNLLKVEIDFDPDSDSLGYYTRSGSGGPESHKGRIGIGHRQIYDYLLEKLGRKPTEKEIEEYIKRTIMHESTHAGHHLADTEFFARPDEQKEYLAYIGMFPEHPYLALKEFLLHPATLENYNELSFLLGFGHDLSYKEGPEKIRRLLTYVNRWAKTDKQKNKLTKLELAARKELHDWHKDKFPQNANQMLSRYGKQHKRFIYSLYQKPPGGK